VPQAIERTSPVPYYEQLFEILRDRIAGGLIAPDERLSSENELCREFGLSRATVRQTLSKLETEGFVRRVARRGVFASIPGVLSAWIVQDAHGFLESQLRHGRTGIATKVIEAQYISPPQHAADALGVDSGDRVFALERLRSLDGRIAMFSTNWFPQVPGQRIAAADDVLHGAGSVNTTLRNAGFLIGGGHRVLRAMRAPGTVAGHLRIRPDQPVLRLRTLSWDHEDVPVEYHETWVLTDVIALEVNVVAT